MNTYLAHIADDGRTQTVKDHLTGTANLASEFARAFGAADQAELAGLAHDIGKYTAAFQLRLQGGHKVDHATYGAYECFMRRRLAAAFAAMGHHGHLTDGGGKGDTSDSGTFFGRIKRAKSGVLDPDPVWRQEISLPEAAVPAWANDRLEGMFFTRMLYSCLVDADYLDTEAFMDGHARQMYDGPDIDALWSRLSGYISGWFPPKSELNAQRCAILERCISEGRTKRPGMFTLTVPTGGGKTVASLAFALAYARAHGLKRVIYVIPYTSIIEQTAETFRNILGDESVLEHHSNVQYDIAVDGEADGNELRMLRATENWDAPVVVTTAVQFFESLFACKPSQCRKLHSIAGSVVVLDEAQMLPLPYLRPCVWTISQLVKHYNVSAVLCTATQPALNPLLDEFLPGTEPVELCPEQIFSASVFRRVTFRRAGRLSWDELAQEMNNRRQALCIVNARKSAQTIFSKLNGEGCFHLSTLMCPAHRQAQLAEIRRLLSGGLPCRVVSTSLIEAGVDVDFPAVYREEAGLDSVLQAAGRCNREGKRAADESVVTVFQGEDRPPKLFDTQIEVGRMAIERQTDLASRRAVRDYFHELFEVKGRAAQDQKDIMGMMAKQLFPFQKVAEMFHIIDNATRTVYIPVGEGTALVDSLRHGERSRSLFRKLGRYGVSVYENHFQSLDSAGALELLEDGSAVLLNTNLYSEQTGLSLQAEGGQGIIL